MSSMHRFRLLVVGLMVPITMSAQSNGPVGSALDEVTFAKDIALILQRSCQRCHRPGVGGADVAPDLRRGAPLGSSHQDADRPPKQARRHAAVVPREGHRDSALQE